MSSEEYTSESGSMEESDEEFHSKSKELKVTPIKAG